MSIEGHDRRLIRVAEKGWAKDNSLASIVYAIEREHRRRRAALALVAVAQALTGTDETPEPVHEEPSPPRADPFGAPSPRSRARVWGGNNRPGPHDVLTWQEVMRIPWLDDSAATDQH